MNNSHSSAVSGKLFDRATQSIPGGVNSPVRAFGGVGGVPRFIKRAEGPFLFDADGNKLIDCIGSWGPMILGHAAPQVIEQVQKQLSRGLSYGAPTELEIEMAEKMREFIPWLEQIRMVNSGTEATMSAIRLARGVTGRNRIIKFAGCYHGHEDALLVDAGSGALTFGNPGSAGVPKSTVANTIVLPYNDITAVDQVFSESQGENAIAAVIVEPVAGNMNLVPGEKSWLETLQTACKKHGALLIFDEVMSGFRVAPGGAAQLYDIVPDLVCYGKVIGGGFPVGAFGGKAEYLSHLAPLGKVYQAGTLSGNPVAMCAGLATLEYLQQHVEIYNQIEKKLQRMLHAWQQSAQKAGIALNWIVRGTMFGFFFSDVLPTNLEEVKKCDIEAFKRFFHNMLAQRIYLAPSAFEAGFFSTTHDDRVVLGMTDSAERVFANGNSEISQ